MEKLNLQDGYRRLNIDNKFDSDEEVYIEVEDTYDGGEIVFYANKPQLEDIYSHIGELLGK
ncbi:hypothetical protein MG295_00191 [Bacillus phage vB_BcgM]|nr:hypothetical protein MG295_00191 [Bacillus phage vB_BcgM]